MASISAPSTYPPSSSPSSSSSRVSPSVFPLSLKERGILAFSERHYQLAAQLFGEAILAEPNEPALYNNRSAAYSALGQFECALADSEFAVSLKRDWAKAYWRMGIALEGLGQYTRAREAFDTAHRLDPSDTLISRSLSQLAFRDSPLDEPPPFAALTGWLRASGAIVPQSTVAFHAENNRGVVSLSAIRAGESFLFVPERVLLTQRVAADSDIGRKIAESGITLASSHSLLACFLLQEKSCPSSVWSPYMSFLPRHYRNLPIFFDPAEFEFLKGSLIVNKVADRKAELKEEFDRIYTAVPDFRRFTIEEFIIARVIVITRVFGLTIDGKPEDALVPYADLLNHRRPPATAWRFDDVRRGFCLTALEDIARGEEISDSYGKKCNSRFLLNYGFALEYNEDNQAQLFLPGPDPASPLAARCLRFLSSLSAPHAVEGARRRFQLSMGCLDDAAQEAFSYLRILHANDSELQLLESLALAGPAAAFNARRVSALSLRNELLVLATLAEAAREGTKAFAQTLDEDYELLKADSLLPPTSAKRLSANQRHCVLMRRGEKEVLAFYAALHDEARRFIQTGGAAKEIKKHQQLAAVVKAPLALYIQQAIAPFVGGAENKQ